MVDFGFAVDPLVLAAGLLLVIGTAAAVLAQRLQVPALLLFLALGMLIGDDGLAWLTLDEPEVAQTAGVLALLVILFEGGLTTRHTDLRRAAGSAFTLATLGVVVTAVITAAGAWLITGGPWLTALLIGAVVASTDAAAVFTAVRRSPLPKRLTSLLEVESGSNDPMAVLLTIGVLEVWRAGGLSVSEVAAFGVMQLGGGALVGAAVGGLAVALLRRAHAAPATLVAVFALGAAGVAYGAAAWVGASGFLAVYGCGLLIGLFVPRHRRVIRSFHQGLAGVAEIGLFFLLGLLVFPSQLPAVAVPALAITAVLIFVARPATVALCLGWQMWTGRSRPGELTLLSWAGLRGAVPIVLATFPLTAGYPGGGDIFNIVFFVVLASVLLQGSTIGPMARLLGLRDQAPRTTITEFLPADEPDIDIVEVTVADDMPIAGERLRDVATPGAARIAAIVRDGDALIPDGDTRIEPRDRLMLIVASDPANEAIINDWARGTEPPHGS